MPIARVRGPVERRRGGLRGCSWRPGSRRRARWMSVLCQSRVAASQQNAASSRAHAIATVPVRLPRVPARCVQRSCRRRWQRHAICTTRGSWPAWRACETQAHGGLVTVVVGGLDQQPAGVRRTGLRDLALGALIVGGVLARHHAEEPREQRWLGEAGEVADFRAQSGGCERVDPAEAAQPCDRLGVAALGDRLLECVDQRATALHEPLRPRSR